MAQVEFYRYIDDFEAALIIRTKKLEGRGGVTWYTPGMHDLADDAQKYLAMSYRPTHRVGPIPADEMPPFDIPLRPVAPANNQSGGGVEARTDKPKRLFDISILK